MRRYHVTTFGCQMNAHDSERIKGMLESLGLGEATAPEDADVLVFNTCTIREKPDTKLAAYLGEAIARKRADPSRVIAVGGCYAEAQRERIFDAVIDKVEVKALGELSPREIEHDNPQIRRVDEMLWFLSQLYNREVAEDEIVTLIRFSQIT